MGAGMMGTAFTFPCADAGHAVRLVGTPLDDDVIAALRRQRVHPGLGVELPASVEPLPHAALGAALGDAEVVGIGVSSAGVDWAGRALGSRLRPGVPLVMITKGLALAASELQLLPDRLQQLLPEPVRDQVFPVAVAGPCIAGELARRAPTTVLFTGRDPRASTTLGALLATPYYLPLVAEDLVGVECCAALKNAYALGVACVAGLHERAGGAAGAVAMHNLESAVFTQGIWEMQRVVQALGGDPATAAGLAGVGDLHVTCNAGRTSRFGRLLGSGIDLSRALESFAGITLECREILAVMRAALPGLGRSGRILAGELPLLERLAAIALDGAPVELAMQRFFGRRGST